MAHPNVIRYIKRKAWHLEDQYLTLVEAKALVKHLRKTEEKLATYNKTERGYQVWWAKK